MGYLENLDYLVIQYLKLNALVDLSNKEFLKEFKQLEIELLNIIQFSDEISIFKTLILKELGINVEEDYSAKVQNKTS